MASAREYLQSILAQLARLQALDDDELAFYAPDLHDIDSLLDDVLFDAEEQGYDDGSSYADALNREAEENMLGRPLFPNEY